MKKKTLWVLIATLLLAIPVAWAITTTTQVNFNIGAVVAYTLTLPGESAVDANLTGAPTTAIEFNSTNGTEPFINPRVVGGAAQTGVTPIFQFDNTGTVDLNITVQFTAAPPNCTRTFGSQVFGNLTGNGTVINTTNVTVTTGYAPSDPAQDWFMQSNFTGCTASDTTTRTLRSDGIQS